MIDDHSENLDGIGQGWEPCPEGTLSRVASVLRSKQSAAEALARRNLLAGVVALLAIVLGAGIAAREADRRAARELMELMPVSQIGCDQAAEFIPQIIERRLCREESRMVRYHIDVCPRCSKKYYGLLYESQPPSDAPQPSPMH